MEAASAGEIEVDLSARTKRRVTIFQSIVEEEKINARIGDFQSERWPVRDFVGLQRWWDRDEARQEKNPALSARDASDG